MISVHVGTGLTVEGEVGERTKLSVLVNGEWPEEHGAVVEGEDDEAFARVFQHGPWGRSNIERTRWFGAQ